jgi:hypothetical protein
MRFDGGLSLLRLQVAGCLCLNARAQRCSIDESLERHPGNLAQISFFNSGTKCRFATCDIAKNSLLVPVFDLVFRTS